MSFDLKTIRSRLGDLSVPFVGFVVSAALAIATITGLAQFNATKTKVDAALVEGQRAASNYVVENLNDSALLESPLSAETNSALAAARDAAINAMIDSMGQPVGESLISANGGSGYSRAAVYALFDIAGTVVSANSGRIDISMAVNTRMHSAVPVDYQQQTDTISASPSEFALGINQKSLSCPDGGDCGECGQCDEATGQCIPDDKVLRGNGGYRTPDTPAADGKIACKAHADTLAGRYCVEVGWNLGTENSYESCIDPSPGVGNECRITDNYTHWRINRNGGSPGVIAVSWAGVPIGGSQAETVESFCHGNDYYFRVNNPRFPYAINGQDADAPSYAICRGQPDTFQTIFMTQRLVNGDILSDANSLGAGITASASAGGAAADFICDYEATRAGLTGTYKAIIGAWSPPLFGSCSLGCFLCFPSYIKNPIFDVPNAPYATTNSDVVNICNLWDESIDNPINYDQFGNPIAFGEQAWTGATASGYGYCSYPSDDTYDCSNWQSNNAGFTGIVGNSSQTDFRWMGMVGAGFGFPVTASCDTALHLICAEV